MSVATAAVLATAAASWPRRDAALSLMGVCAYSASRASRHQLFALGDSTTSSIQLIGATVLDAIAWTLQAQSRDAFDARAMLGFAVAGNFATLCLSALVGDARDRRIARALWYLVEPRRELWRAAAAAAALALLPVVLLIVVRAPRGLLSVVGGVIVYVVASRLTILRLGEAIAVGWLALGVLALWVSLARTGPVSPCRGVLPLRRSGDASNRKDVPRASSFCRVF